MSTHTPGTWSSNAILTAKENDDFRYATAVWSTIEVDGDDPIERLICSVSPDAFVDWQASKEERTANARLIAAAPALLAACRAAAEHFDGTDAPLGTVLRDALKLAEGKG